MKEYTLRAIIGDNIKKKFDIITSLDYEDLQIIFNSWLFRTRVYSKESFVDYVKSKNDINVKIW